MSNLEKWLHFEIWDNLYCDYWLFGHFGRARPRGLNLVVSISHHIKSGGGYMNEVNWNFLRGTLDPTNPMSRKCHFQFPLPLSVKSQHNRAFKLVWINLDLPNGCVRFRCFWDTQHLQTANRQSRGSDVLRAPCPGRRSIWHPQSHPRVVKIKFLADPVRNRGIVLSDRSPTKSTCRNLSGRFFWQ